LPHVFADFPISKYLFRTEEAPADRAYKEYMESTKPKRDQLQKIGGPRLAAFEKQDAQVRAPLWMDTTHHLINMRYS
jgi:hypothetical protein